jgi:hypothetical protein
MDPFNSNFSSLQNLASQNIRQNYNIHQDDPFIFNIIYNDLIKQYPPNEPILKHMKLFDSIIITSKPIRIIENNRGIRNDIYDHCSNLGLNCTMEKKKRQIIVNITKPDDWRWEFSKLSEDHKTLCDQYKLDSIQEDYDNIVNKLSQIHCQNCNRNGFETRLYCLSESPLDRRFSWHLRYNSYMPKKIYCKPCGLNELIPIVEEYKQNRIKKFVCINCYKTGFEIELYSSKSIPIQKYCALCACNQYSGDYGNYSPLQISKYDQYIINKRGIEQFIYNYEISPCRFLGNIYDYDLLTKYSKNYQRYSKYIN